MAESPAGSGLSGGQRQVVMSANSARSGRALTAARAADLRQRRQTRPLLFVTSPKMPLASEASVSGVCERKELILLRRGHTEM
jgi:hypothetical protein